MHVKPTAKKINLIFKETLMQVAWGHDLMHDLQNIPGRIYLLKLTIETR